MPATEYSGHRRESWEGEDARFSPKSEHRPLSEIVLPPSILQRIPVCQGSSPSRQWRDPGDSKRPNFNAPAPRLNMTWLQPTVLKGKYGHLEPLSHRHHDELVAATLDGQLWELWYTSVPHPDQMSEEIDRRLKLQDQGSMLPMTVFDADNVAVGMTTFMNADPISKRVEIGSTWYCQRVQRTALNTQCKRLLLEHAFETLECIAVEFRTSRMNRASQRAIERLGATRDGVLRSHQRHTDGTIRDTCVYSIIQCEWPTVRSHLDFLLSR